MEMRSDVAAQKKGLCRLAAAHSRPYLFVACARGTKQNTKQTKQNRLFTRQPTELCACSIDVDDAKRESAESSLRREMTWCWLMHAACTDH